MYIHNKILSALLSVSFIFYLGCATSYAPDNWLPDTDDVPQNVFGGWITVITEPDSLYPEEKWMEYSGEFIASEDSVICLLYDSLYQIPKHKITESILELDEKNTTAYGLWVLGGSVLTISNGYYAAFTLPLWLGFGIPTVVGESARDRYEMEYPDEQYWDSVKVFARFPQGTNEIDLSQLKPLFVIQKSE